MPDGFGGAAWQGHQDNSVDPVTDIVYTDSSDYITTDGTLIESGIRQANAGYNVSTGNLDEIPVVTSGNQQTIMYALGAFLLFKLGVI